MRVASLALLAALAAASALVHGQSVMKGMDMKQDAKAAADAAHKASGKVTRVDPAKGSVTVAHGPVASKNWPAMTMSFKARDKALLEKVKPGDQVEFTFIESGKDYTITEIR